MTDSKIFNLTSGRDGFLAQNIILKPTGDINLLTLTREEHENFMSASSDFLFPLSNFVPKGLSSPNTIDQGSYLNLDIPPLNEQMTKRNQTVDNLLTYLRKKPLLYLQGSVGYGKTYLGQLIAAKLNMNTLWFRLRSLSDESACYVIENTLTKISGVQPCGNKVVWIKQIFETIKHPCFIVFDDLPEVTTNGSLMELLQRLALEANQHQSLLLSTSNYYLSSRIRNALDEYAHYINSPEFTDEDIKDLFGLQGAPIGYCESVLPLITICTNRHPLFVHTAVTYLKNSGWKNDGNTFDGIITKQYAHDIFGEMQKAISGMNQKDKELLYRLSVFDITFQDKDVDCISEIHPAIDYWGERFERLIGGWIQSEINQSYIVSPAIRNLGEKNLDKKTLKTVHGIVASHILNKGNITPFEGMSAIGHLKQAELFQEMASVFYNLLKNLIDNKDVHKDVWGITSMWYGVVLPRDISLGLRLLLRVTHIEACEKVKKDVKILVSDLTSLVNHIDPHNELDCIAAAAVSMKLAKIDFETACIAFTKIIQAKVDFSKYLPSGNYQWEAIIWVFVNEIDTPRKLELWVDCFMQMSDEQLYNAERTKIAGISEYGYHFAADKVWLNEEKKPENQRNWPKVIRALKKLEDCALRRKRHILWAYAIRAQCIILAEYQKQLKKAVALAQTGFEIADEMTAKYLLSEIIAREYAHAKSYPNAQKWFEKMLTFPIEGLKNERIDGLLHACEAVGNIDANEAVRYSELAVILIRDKRERFLSGRKVKVLAEHALALWYAKGPEAAFDVYEEAANVLLSSKNNTIRWKALFAVFGHVSGYFCSVAAQGEPPTMEHGEYFAPTRGLFRKYSEEAASTYEESKACLLWSQICLYAEAINRLDSAKKWAVQGYQKSKECDYLVLLSAVPALIVDNRYTEALDAASSFATAMVSFSNTSDANMHISEAERLLGKKPSDEWNKAENATVFYGFILIYLKLATIRIINASDNIVGLNELEEYVEQCLENASNPELWRRIIMLLDALKSEESNLDSSIFKQYPQADLGRTSLHALYYIYITTNLAPNDMLKALLAILPSIERDVIKASKLSANIVIEYVEALVEKTITASRFCLTCPSIVVQEINDLKGRSLPTVRKMIKVLAQGLGVQISEEGKQWLNETNGLL